MKHKFQNSSSGLEKWRCLLFRFVLSNLNFGDSVFTLNLYSLFSPKNEMPNLGIFSSSIRTYQSAIQLYKKAEKTSKFDFQL